MDSSLEPFRIFATGRNGFLGPLKVGLFCAVVGALAVSLVPNHFKSTSRLLPLEARSAGGSMAGLANAAAAFGFSLPGSDGSDTNFVDIVNSRWMREALLQTEFTYHETRWPFGSQEERRQTLFQYLGRKNADRAVRQMDKVLACYRDTKSKVITLEVETTSRDLSQQVAQKAVSLLEEFLLRRNQSRGGFKAAFAEKRLAESKVEARQAEETLRTFLDRNRNYVASADPAVRLEGLRLEGELKLRQQLIATLAVNREQALLEEKNDVPILNVLDPPNCPIDKTWPPRSAIVVFIFVLAGAGRYAWEQRAHLRAMLIGSVDAPPPPSTSYTELK